MIDIIAKIKECGFSIPYTTNPRMIKNTGCVFNKEPSRFYLEEKNKQLEKYKTDLYAQTELCSRENLIFQSSKLIGIPEQSNIKNLAMLYEEDIAIIHNGKLEAICFCFPSSWIPRERIGYSLSDIHRPVADSDKLVAASDRIARTICDPVLGSFRRYVWTITNNPGLSNHPAEKIFTIPNSINDLYFRLETQTTLPFPTGQSALFFVKVDIVPLSDIWHEFGEEIKNSVNSMTDSILMYKNLTNVKPILNKVLLM